MMKEFPEFKRLKAEISAALIAAAAQRGAIAHVPPPAERRGFASMWFGASVNEAVWVEIQQKTSSTNRWLSDDAVDGVVLEVPRGVWSVMRRRYPVKADGSWSIKKVVDSIVEALEIIAARAKAKVKADAKAACYLVDRERASATLKAELAVDGFQSNGEGEPDDPFRSNCIAFFDRAGVSETVNFGALEAGLDLRIRLKPRNVAECVAMVRAARKAVESMR